jgi:hypothetical protein
MPIYNTLANSHPKIEGPLYRGGTLDDDGMGQRVFPLLVFKNATPSKDLGTANSEGGMSKIITAIAAWYHIEIGCYCPRPENQREVVVNEFLGVKVDSEEGDDFAARTKSALKKVEVGGCLDFPPPRTRAIPRTGGGSNSQELFFRAHKT